MQVGLASNPGWPRRQGRQAGSARRIHDRNSAGLSVAGTRVRRYAGAVAPGNDRRDGWAGQTTVRPSRGASGSDVARLPALTMLYHANPDRVGHIAPLYGLVPGRQVSCSRLEPAFGPAGGPFDRPLQDPRVSRRPIVIRRRPDGVVEVEAPEGVPLRVGGDEVVGSRALPAEALRHGVVLTVAYAVVLLLHEVVSLEADRPLGLIGLSPMLRTLRRSLSRIAPVDVPVLITGESGVGKELVARALHDASRKASGPFVAVNMATVLPSTAVSTLFGHGRGAFTGAAGAHRGLFERADGGTLFLDEIGATPPEVQDMLLRALETGEVAPLGSERSRRVDVRVVAATDADLAARSGDGSFRLPLLQRLAGCELHVPTLRERIDDIPRLLRHFLHEELRQIGTYSAATGPHPADWIEPGLVERLCLHPWPGNVRQLRNVALRIAVERVQGAPMSGVGLDRVLGTPGNSGSADGAQVGSAGGAPPVSPAARARAGRRRPGDIPESELAELLERHGWELKPAAQELGISRTTLYALVDRMPSVRKASELPVAEILAALQAAGDEPRKAADRLRVSHRGLALRMRALGMDVHSWRRHPPGGKQGERPA